MLILFSLYQPTCYSLPFVSFLNLEQQSTQVLSTLTLHRTLLKWIISFLFLLCGWIIKETRIFSQRHESTLNTEYIGDSVMEEQYKMHRKALSM